LLAPNQYGQIFGLHGYKRRTRSKRANLIFDSACHDCWRLKTIATAKHIEHWPLDRFIPYARNPRTHSDAQIAQIAASIVEFGFTDPILVRQKRGSSPATAAYLLAARKLRLDTAPVIVLDHLTETQKRAYVIADNKLALNAGWDDELLALEFTELRDHDFDLNLTGFDVGEIDKLLAASDDETANETPPVPENPVSHLGDLWICGDTRLQHRVLCGDCTDSRVVTRLLGERKPFLTVTYPPYGIELDSEWRDRAGSNGCGPAEASYMKHRTAGHTNTSISSDTSRSCMDDHSGTTSYALVFERRNYTFENSNR
jgi:hypothetical protein